MDKNSQISVILPVYNAERYIRKSISSVLDQTYKNLELIIIDDGSTDSSPEIIKSFNDKRIRFYAHSHSGLISQLNFGLKAAEGHYIARMDADDMEDPERLKIQMNYLQNHSEISLVSTNYNYIDDRDNIVSTKVLPENNDDIEYMMPILNSVCHAGMLTYKSSIIEAGGYREMFLFVEDQDLFLRMISLGLKMYNIQEALYSYRLKKKKISQQDRNILLKNRYQLGNEYLGKYYNSFSEGSFPYYFRYGLMEYYSGNINTARNYFLKAAKLDHPDKQSVYRYLLPSLLGHSVINFLRNNNILAELSLFSNKLGRDYHRIIKNG